MSIFDTPSMYDMVEMASKTFSNALNLPFDVSEMLGAHGDKCYQYQSVANKYGYQPYQLCMVYLLSYMSPYSTQVRDTSNGWVDIRDWLEHMFKDNSIIGALKVSAIADLAIFHVIDEKRVLSKEHLAEYDPEDTTHILKTYFIVKDKIPSEFYDEHGIEAILTEYWLTSQNKPSWLL